MRTDAEEKLEENKLELRNLDRKLWNAEHTYRSNKGELQDAIRSHAEKHMIRSRQKAIAYWKEQIEKFEGKIFLLCLQTGLDKDRAWN
jgi:hypothetical protein